MLNRRAEEGEGLSFPMIAVIIVTVIALAGIVFFALGSQKDVKEGIEENIDTLVYNATDLADCMLWAAGAKDDFDCTKTFCMHDTICKACEHYGEYYNVDKKQYIWHVNDLGCKLSDVNQDGKPEDFAGCKSCNI